MFARSPTAATFRSTRATPWIAALSDAGIAYVFLGKELGARSDNPDCYWEGKVQYDRLAQEPIFAEGISRVMEGMERYRIALTCAEKDPLDCHRALLVARKLFETGVTISHIHTDGSLESHQAMESRLLAACKLPEGDLFTSRAGVRRRRLSHSRRAGRLPGKSRGTNRVVSRGAASRGGWPMKLFTIGFTKKSAEQFFTRLKQPGLVRLVDARLNNVSQLAGFTKKHDLQFFLREICHIDYVHRTELAPTQDILDAYKKNGGDWSVYEKQFWPSWPHAASRIRSIRICIAGGCLLCSEPTPEHCHRRLVAEYFREKWGDVEIVHL